MDKLPVIQTTCVHVLEYKLRIVSELHTRRKIKIAQISGLNS